MDTAIVNGIRFDDTFIAKWSIQMPSAHSPRAGIEAVDEADSTRLGICTTKTSRRVGGSAV